MALELKELAQEAISAGRSKASNLERDLTEHQDPHVLTEGRHFWLCYGERPTEEQLKAGALPAEKRTGPFYSMKKAEAWFSGGGR